MDDAPERRVWDERRPTDRVTSQIILAFTLTPTCPQNICTGLCKCKYKYINIYIYIHCCNRIIVSVKKIWTCVSVNDYTLTHDLHVIYMTIDTYMHNTRNMDMQLRDLFGLLGHYLPF